MKKMELFKVFDGAFEAEPQTIERFKALVNNQPNDYFGKRSNVAHITGSGVVIDESGEYVLLTQHKKLKRWLQLGGHWCDYDDEPTETILEAALREVREEGYGNKEITHRVLNNGMPLDLDIHSVGDHFHYDVCFLVEVDRSIEIATSDESEHVEWKKVEDLIKNHENYNPRLIEMLKKAQKIKTPSNSSKSTFKR